MKAPQSKSQHTMETRASKKRKSDPSHSTPNPGNDCPTSKRDAAVHVIKKDVKKRVKGKLSGLVKLPIDILFEVFRNLKPFDLLRIARTTKDFRRLLMNKSSKSVWKACLETAGLPPCPPEMAEPVWVNLAFDPHCHFCNKAMVRGVEWLLRVRICNKCAKDKMTYVYLPEEIPVGDTDNFPVATLLLSRPYKLRPWSNAVQVFRDDLKEMKRKYSLLPNKEARNAFIRERRKDIFDVQMHASLCLEWSETQIMDRSSELRQLRDARRDAIIEKLKALGYEEDIVSIRHPYSLEDQEHVRKPQILTERVWANVREPVIRFMDKMRAIRLKREHTELVLQRKPKAVAVFHAYMVEHYPYTDVMPSGLDFCSFGPVKEILEEPTEMDVDEASFANVVPRIPEFITNWRQTLDGHLIQVMKEEDRFKHSNFSSYHYAWTSRWNDFGEFVDKSRDDSRSDESDDASDRNEDNGNKSVPSWGSKNAKSPNTDISPLDEAILADKLKLATTVFQCSKCIFRNGEESPSSHDDLDFPSDEDVGYEGNDYLGYNIPRPGALFYPKVKGHICLTRKAVAQSSMSWWEIEEPQTPPEPARKLDNACTQRRQWSTHPLRINSRLGECVRVLVEKAGLDPHTTTADELDSLGVWFGCLQCAYNCSDKNKSPYLYEMSAFPWRLAVEHQGWEHHKSEASWIKINPEDIDEAVEAFKSNNRSSYNKPALLGQSIPRTQEVPLPQDATWSCIHCRDTSTETAPTSMDEIRTHLEEQHQIQQPEENKDYYKDFAALPRLQRQRRVVVLLSSKEAQEARKARKAKKREGTVDLDVDADDW